MTACSLSSLRNNQSNDGLKSLTIKQMVLICLLLLTTSLWHVVRMSPLYSFSPSLSLSLPLSFSHSLSLFTEIIHNLSLFRHSWLIMAWCGWGRNLTRLQPSTQTNCHQTVKRRRRRRKKRRRMSGDQVCIMPSTLSVYTINVIITLYVSYQY